VATRDVQFIIRARDEASRAFEGINSALEQLTQLERRLARPATSSAPTSANSFRRSARSTRSRASSTALPTAPEIPSRQQRAKVKALEGDLANLKAQSAAARTR
jgi:flagellar hook-associated protein FlgK